MEKKVENKQNKIEKPYQERIFQVFLVVLGVVLGTIGTYVWGARNDRHQEECLVRLVKANVQQEMRLAKSIREYLKAKKDVERLVPQGFDSVHEPTLYLSIQGSLSQLDDALMVDLLGYHRTMQSCLNTKNLFQEGLSWCQKNKGKPIPKGYLENYVTALEMLEKRAEKVLSTIESLYPSIILETEPEQGAPNISEHDFGGYVPQQD